MSDPLRDRVRCGATYLDLTSSYWHELVDLPRFDMADPKHCILGQVGGDFAFAVHSLLYPSARILPLLEEPFAIGYYGFDLYPHEPRDLYPRLTELWRAEIASRAVPKPRLKPGRKPKPKKPQ